MSSTAKKLIELTPALKVGIQKAKKEIFGTLPNTLGNQRRGHQVAKRQLTGVYLNQYYPEPIETFARRAIPGYTSELEDRRTEKLANLRRKGKGPPKKGSGKKKK